MQNVATVLWDRLIHRAYEHSTKPPPLRLCSQMGYCNALRAGGGVGPLCPHCDAIETWVSAFQACLGEPHHE
jgi:hypothetical protein